MIRITQEEFDRAARKVTAAEQLYEELERLKEEYEKRGQGGTLPEFDMPDELELERVEAERTPEEELKKRAEAENAAKYADKSAKAEAQAAEKEKRYNERIEDAEADAAKRAEKADELYGARKREAEQQAIRRGLARSSIIMGQIAAFDENRLGERMSIDEQARKEIVRLQQEIDAAAAELEGTKAAYDEQERAAVETRLAQLLDEQEEKYLAAVKFNNDVEKKQADYKRQREAALLARAKTASQLDKDKYVYGSETGQGAYLGKKFEAVKSYLDGMDKGDALKALEGDKVIREALGSYYQLMRRYLESK